jgi:hypothetical protein
MSPFRILGAVAILSTIALPASTQPIISEPGYCAFFYPNANCQNKGPGNPYTDPNYQRGLAIGAGDWRAGETVGTAPRRSRTRAAPSSRMQ